MFALAVTASVQLVGVYLVFSSLIIPALATRSRTGSSRYRMAYAIGVAGYAIGLALSALLDLPSGAVIVWTLAACALIGATMAGSKGTQSSSARTSSVRNALYWRVLADSSRARAEFPLAASAGS